jgi:hypothetical protein
MVQYVMRPFEDSILMMAYRFFVALLNPWCAKDRPTGLDPGTLRFGPFYFEENLSVAFPGVQNNTIIQ